MSLSEFLRSPAFRRPRAIARQWAFDHVDRPLIGAARVGSALRQGRDVLYLGESSMLHISPFDTDRRRLAEMFAEESGFSVAAYYGPGYAAGIFSEVARLAEDLPRPRCVVISIVLRNGTHKHVSEHPIFSYRHAREALASAPRLGPTTVRAALRPAPPPEAYAAFEALERTSLWGGDRTIGSYRAQLRGFNAWEASDQLQRTIFDYFHGEYSAGSPGLDDWEELGVRLRKLDVPVFAYRGQMPMGNGRRLLGESFQTHVEENFRLVEDRLLRGLGGNGQLIPMAELPDAAFVHAADATEHLNETGRAVVVQTVTDALRGDL